jgi:GT2 family glycosyltransferase
MLGFLPAGHGANLGFAKTVWEEIGGFDEEFEFGGPDIEFCWRAQLSGIPLTPVPDAIVHYRLRPSLSALYKQSRAYGAAEAHLFRVFSRYGMSRRRATAPLSDLWWQTSRLPLAAIPSRRGAWVRRLGQLAGRVEGAARYKVLWW